MISMSTLFKMLFNNYVNWEFKLHFTHFYKYTPNLKSLLAKKLTKF